MSARFRIAAGDFAVDIGAFGFRHKNAAHAALDHVLNCVFARVFIWLVLIQAITAVKSAKSIFPTEVSCADFLRARSL
jgi:hypothetical protein